MNNKIYIINFDKGGNLDKFDYNNFHNELISAEGIINWWHYIGSSYIIVTNWNINAHNVTELVQQLMPEKYFFVCELNLKNHNGWLPEKAWEWINTYAK